MPRLSSDTKAVLRELRRHDRELEGQVRRLADAIGTLSLEVGDAVQNGAIELVLRKREPRA